MSEESSWIIGSEHDNYGEVKMMGCIEGEPYRWFIDDDGVVSMIPLDVLRSETFDGYINKNAS